MGVWLRAFDWEKTPLGAISSWPQSLKTTIDLMMASQLAMHMMWGPERIQIYNESQRAFMGTKHPRAFGRPARETWGEVWEAGEPTHQRVFAGETVTLEDHPWTLLRNGGPEETFFTSYFTPLRDEAGVVVATFVTAFETTQAVKEKAERGRAERALRESEARLQAAVDLVGLGRYAWNPQTNELQWDDTLRAMWGLAAGAPVDYEVRRAGVHPDDLARFEAAIQRSVDPRGDGVYDIEYRVIGKADGVERWIAARGRTNFENDAPVSSFGVALDVTGRKRIERRLERRVEDRTRELEEANRQLRSQIEKREIAEAEVQQLQRLDAIGQITSGVAHDFNNLLSVVLTNARLLSRTVQRPDDQEGIELIRNAAERGAKLIAQLLAFSRQQQLEPLGVDLNSKLVGMGNLLSVTLGGTLQLKTTFAPDLWPALVDPNQIEMIVLNLAINARDAMQPCGTLTLGTFNTVIKSESSRPEEPSPGDYVALAVKDTGIGIADEVLAHVFEPFFTTKEPGKGSGLGLAQVFGFAKQSGGGVRIETRLGQGTAVTIFLPRAEVDVSDDQADFIDASNRPQTTKRLRVLVVDDDKAKGPGVERVMSKSDCGSPA
jgi:PAS domain S-box-containing protein